jgi:bisanhydrobacterioruberin hydratase
MSEKSKTDLIKPLGWLIGLHVIGLLGLKFHETQDIFTRLIPINLAVTAGFLLYYQKHWNMRIIGFLFFVFFVGFALEVVGVQTGKLFGVYHYGKALGPKLWDVPIVMGLTWLILVYCAGIMVKGLEFHPLLKAGIAAAMMVMLDVLIEPVAMKLGLWGWEHRRVPLLNYASWFVISYLFVTLQLNLKAPQRFGAVCFRHHRRVFLSHQFILSRFKPSSR